MAELYMIKKFWISGFAVTVYSDDVHASAYLKEGPGTTELIGEDGQRWYIATARGGRLDIHPYQPFDVTIEVEDDEV